MVGNMTKNVAQQAAFILIDSVVAFTPNTPPGEETPMNIAVRRLNEVDGMVLLRSDSEGTPSSVDISPVVNGAIVSIYILSAWLANERGVDIETVMAELREQHDLLWSE